jgi:hypothetical protein
MKRGDIAVVYQDPVTKQRPEGRALLLKALGPRDEWQEYWRVRFLSDDASQRVDRWVDPRDIEERR